MNENSNEDSLPPFCQPQNSSMKDMFGEWNLFFTRRIEEGVGQEFNHTSLLDSGNKSPFDEPPKASHTRIKMVARMRCQKRT